MFIQWQAQAKTQDLQRNTVSIKILLEIFLSWSFKKTKYYVSTGTFLRILKKS